MYLRWGVASICWPGLGIVSNHASPAARLLFYCLLAARKRHVYRCSTLIGKIGAGWARLGPQDSGEREGDEVGWPTSHSC